MKFEKLGNICDLQNGFAFKSSDYVEFSNTLCCRMSNIRPNATFDIDYNPKYLPDSFSIKFKDYLLNDGDLIIAMTDMANDPKILGVPTQVFTNGKKLLLNQRVGKLVNFDTKKVYVPYVKLALSRNELKEYYKKFAGGGIQLNISKQNILNIKIPLPELQEQIRIAKILTQAENLITQRKESIVLLDEFLKSTFLEMFNSGDNFKGKEYSINELKVGGNETFSNGPFGSDLLTSELKKSGVPVIYIRDITNGYYKVKSNVYVTEEKAQYLKNCQVIGGDILITKVGDPPGISAIYPYDLPSAIITQDVIRLRVNKKIVHPIYFSFFLNSDKGKSMIKAISVEGTRKRFPLGDFKKSKIKIPNIEFQNQFALIVEKVESLKTEYEASLQELENMYGVLSQKAFKGELFKENEMIFETFEKYSKRKDQISDIQTPVAGSLEPPKEVEGPPVFQNTEKDIKDMTLDEYYGIPEDIVAKYGSIENHIEDKEFILKKIFHDSSIDLKKLEEIYNKMTYERGGFFDFEDWRKYIFEELAKKKSFLKQKYNPNTNQLELSINEIKKS
ncbi:restriction endonuclease subunit S [Flavobacterium oreochromis]|uniref:restriction endonuclease subunit S n=1 Tax=Flavobacterium oreochromis TaxID=2906078 RepID=UPI000B4CF80D|nr:restriction endonuclease subunit S [Flavobacterium oreochromis]OWP78354.1 hypothetical protein BWG23_02465 [Flavobacterium oreochromis]